MRHAKLSSIEEEETCETGFSEGQSLSAASCMPAPHVQQAGTSMVKEQHVAAAEVSVPTELAPSQQGEALIDEGQQIYQIW